MTLTSLIMAVPLLDLFGPLGCDAFYLFTVAHNTLVVNGGFFMALFRMLCVQFQNYVPSLESLMVSLMKVQLAVTLSGFITAYVGALFYGSSNLFEFCNGYTTEVFALLAPELLVWYQLI